MACTDVSEALSSMIYMARRRRSLGSLKNHQTYQAPYFSTACSAYAAASNSFRNLSPELCGSPGLSGRPHICVFNSHILDVHAACTPCSAYAAASNSFRNLSPEVCGSLGTAKRRPSPTSLTRNVPRTSVVQLTSFSG